MPATAGRVRMPANNRVHSSAALQTHGIWQSAIGYDPYAPAADSKGSKPDSSAATADNAYASFQGLLCLARITGTAAGNETRGACKKCGRVGHLTYQCRNFLSLRDDEEKKGDSAIQAAANAAFEKIKKSANGGREEESESDSDEEDEESSDSDVDPEIERIIAERFGKPLSKKVETLSRKSKKKSSSSDEDGERRRKRRHGRTKRRRSHSHHRRSDFDEDESGPDRDRKYKRRMKKRRENDSDSSSESSDGHQKRSNRHRKRPHKERRSVLSSESESTASSSDEDERRKRREKRRSRGDTGDERRRIDSIVSGKILFF